jgi:hypothetical protein
VKRLSSRPGRTVRVDRSGEFWWFGDKARRYNGSAMMVIHPSDLSLCTATDLMNAMRRVETGYVYVAETDEGYITEDGAPLSRVIFRLVDGELRLLLSYWTEEYDEENQPGRTERLVRPLLKSRRLQFVSCEPDPYNTAPPWQWDISLGFSTRGRMLAELFDAGERVIRLVEAAHEGRVDRTSVAALVRGGMASLLIGQPEGHWLDVKAQHYDFTSAKGEVSLAQAVARFCNAEEGGVVVVGMNTKRIPGGEVIRAVCPVPHNGGVVRRYQQVLEKRLFPPPDGLTVEAVNAPPGMLVLIDVPPQPEELKPFLVHGAIVALRS